MEGGIINVPGHTIHRIDLYRPGQGVWFSVQFLVEEVTPTPDGLSQGNPGGGNICPEQKAHLPAPAENIQGERSPDHSTRDAQPSGACIDQIQWVSQVVLGGASSCGHC